MITNMLIMALTGLITGFGFGYMIGKDTGYAEGYEEAYKAGLGKGFQEGHIDGFNKAASMIRKQRSEQQEKDYDFREKFIEPESLKAHVKPRVN